MGTAGQVEGLAGALLRSVDEPDRIALIQLRLDRYCHRLRNRLNSMKLSLYLARRLSADGPVVEWGRSEEACRSIETLLDQLQVFCAPLHPAPTPGDLSEWLGHRLDEWRNELGRREIRLEAEGPGEPLWCRGDWMRLGQGLDGLVAAWSRIGSPSAVIRLSWGRDVDRCVIRFEADDRLIRLSCDEVESLALPLLARVVASHGGSLTVHDDHPSIELRMPSD
ncbi:ATP-binding protein [Tautonia plasticadhaerens]|uniref:Uncharacterized protein n=1 Tax=Tautonia plasticadhaerens TaxID=2527974 RepID=A0A518GVU3_9BACT|nr:HAMP domain-containing histidine kinase [Tautonia plasticadhaerens]QDV32688.1 hypothetical protein ElP_05240 [Tautonia plasticadhaerens]